MKILYRILLAGLAAVSLSVGAQTALVDSKVQNVTGAKMFSKSALCLAGFTTGSGCLNAPDVAGTSTVWTLPSGGGTLVNTAYSGFAPATSGTSILKGDGSGGTAAYAGTSCTNQFVRALSAAGAATCATVAATDLAATAVTPGSYTAANITVDQQGRLTAAANGSAGGGGDAVTSGTLAQFASTTSAQLAGVISDETGSGALVFGTSPTLGAPSIAKLANLTSNGHVSTSGGDGTLGISATIPATDLSGTIAAGRMPALTGDVTTSAGAVATAIGATKVTSAMLNADVFSTAHSWGGGQTFTAPVLGTPASGVATNLTGTASGLTAGNVTTNANLTGDVTSSGNATTLATVNSNVGSFTNANVTVNAKGLVTAASNGSGLASGTSNPVSPATNDRIFRTDLGLDCYYDGTRWLSVTENSLTMPPARDGLQPYTSGGVTSAMYTPTDASRGGMFITRFTATTFNTTNSVSNFYTIQFRSIDTDNTLTSVGTSFNTSADTVSKYTYHTVTVGAALATTQKLLALSITGTGSPGNLFVSAAVFYRPICN